MTLTGLVQATHKFESPVFKTELYALRSSVPLPPPALVATQQIYKDI